jgi:hypothetical protein
MLAEIETRGFGQLTGWQIIGDRRSPILYPDLAFALSESPTIRSEYEPCGAPDAPP